MTKLDTADKLVRREVATQFRKRALVVTLRAHYIEIQEKGRRDVLSVDYLSLYEFAHKVRFLETKNGGKR
jgi:hypothetical protein